VVLLTLIAFLHSSCATLHGALFSSASASSRPV
jgi:hypothetical protein